jgi:hypothetical protein
VQRKIASYNAVIEVLSMSDQNLPLLRVLAWGAGLQSTMLACMSALGEIDPLDLILHVDLHWESRRTREVRDWYITWLRNHGQEVVILDGGDIRELGIDEHKHMPLWADDGGPLKRKCTVELKIGPQKRFLRTCLGLHPSNPPAPPAGAIEQWIGYTLEEFWERAKPSQVQYIINKWPLAERRLTRQDCSVWFAEHNLPEPPKSGCLGCPYSSASHLCEIRDTEPDSWNELVAFDKAIRKNPIPSSTAQQLFVYQHKTALATAPLDDDAARERKVEAFQPPLWVSCNEAGCGT